MGQLLSILDRSSDRFNSVPLPIANDIPQILTFAYFKVRTVLQNGPRSYLNLGTVSIHALVGGMGWVR